MIYTVLLQDQSSGRYHGSEAPKIGSIIEISLHDEDGNLITKKGILQEIFDEFEF